MGFFETLIADISAKTIQSYLVPHDAIHDHSHVRRLFVENNIHGSGRTWAGQERQRLIPLTSFTRCVDPRLVNMFGLNPSEVIEGTFAGLLIPRFDPHAAVPHPFYQNLHLYCVWMTEPSRVAQVNGVFGRPVFIIKSHADCGAAHKLASDPATWADFPLDKLAKSYQPFCEAMRAEYARTQADNTAMIDFDDYLAIQAGRLATLHAIDFLDHLRRKNDRFAEGAQVLFIHNCMNGWYEFRNPLYAPFNSASVEHTLSLPHEAMMCTEGDVAQTCCVVGA